MARLGWEKFVEEIKGRGDLTKLEKSHQPALHLLRQYRHMGSPVIIAGREWTEEEQQKDLDCEPNQSTMDHIPFMREEFALIVLKGLWVVLP